jgi:hypothetical protein
MTKAADARDCLESARDYLLEASDLVDEAMPGLRASGFRAMVESLIERMKRWDQELANQEAEEDD